MSSVSSLIGRRCCRSLRFASGSSGSTSSVIREEEEEKKKIRGCRPQKASPSPVGRLSREAGLPDPSDWTEAWMWTWEGRRTHVKDDMLSGNITNFAGHATLATPLGELVSLLPALDKETFDYADYYEAIARRDRPWLEENTVFESRVTDADPNPFAAILAGIPVFKTRVGYSPSRLGWLLEPPPPRGAASWRTTAIRSCRFAWNVDLERRQINCNTFCQAWHVTRDLPFIPKMGDFHRWCREEKGVAPLEPSDVALARDVAAAAATATTTTEAIRSDPMSGSSG